MDLKLLLVFLALATLASAKLQLNNGHVYHTYKLAQFGEINVTFAFNDKNGLKPIDKQRVLDMHNVLRAKLASGQELHGWNGDNGKPGSVRMPTAANMMTVEWDDRLAKYAQDWADTCKDGHSPINGASIPGYEKFNLGENLSGDITFLERDMYGEVRWWSYRKFECQKGKQCGHYLNFVGWGMSRVGCGWKVCPQTGATKTTQVCIYAGFQYTALEEGKKRLPIQHEYLAGPPCSACEQGWDYCMSGGLCATKKQCADSPKNTCVPNNKKATCEGNGGKFDQAAGTCTCPASKMGINCAQDCKNSYPDNCGMDCGTSIAEAFFCQKTCGGCGKAASSAYKFLFDTHKAVDSANLKVHDNFENPDAKAKNIDMTTLPDYGKCKNKAAKLTCNVMKVRGYCRDVGLFGESVRYYCPLSCSACDEAKAAKAKKDKEDKAATVITGDVGDISDIKFEDLGGKPTLSKSQMSMLNSIPGLEGLDLSGFKLS